MVLVPATAPVARVLDSLVPTDAGLLQRPRLLPFSSLHDPLLPAAATFCRVVVPRSLLLFGVRWGCQASPTHFPPRRGISREWFDALSTLRASRPLGYDSTEQMLEVEFKHGAVYQYVKV